jgi:hypothetical protein
MKRVLASVEGQTEETFVRDVLAPHLAAYDVSLETRLVATKRVKAGRAFKGGLFTYTVARDEIRRLFRDHNAAAITTMYDLYGLPNDFPGYAARPLGDPYAKVKHLEAALAHDIADRRFYPYLQLHEFEALLFADAAATAGIFPESQGLEDLQKIRAAFASPEEINDHPDSAPSKRLLKIYPGYQKTFHGPLAIDEIGLDTLRKECRHFCQWLEWLESLGDQT